MAILLLTLTLRLRLPLHCSMIVGVEDLRRYEVVGEFSVDLHSTVQAKAPLVTIILIILRWRYKLHASFMTPPAIFNKSIMFVQIEKGLILFWILQIKNSI